MSTNEIADHNRISAIVICRNESENIHGCLESLSWANELLVVDSYSTDDTVKIAREFTRRIIQRGFEGYADQRNYALRQAQSPWVLMVDADERVTPELREEIRAIVATSRDFNGYYIRRRNFFAGKEIRYCGWQRDWVLRLFRREFARYDPVQLHEAVKIDGEIGRCRAVLDHRPYRNLKAYIEKLGRYAELGGKEAAEKGKHASFWRLFFHPIGRFIRMYLLQKGFLDGMHGLVICLLAACYVTLQDLRLWEIEREIRDN